MQCCLVWLQARTFKKVLILCCSLLYFNQSVGRNKWPILPIKTFQVQDLIKRAILYNDVRNYIYNFLYFLVHIALCWLCYAKVLMGILRRPPWIAALFADLVTINCFTGIIFCCRLSERYLCSLTIHISIYINLRVRSDFRRVTCKDLYQV